jgi:hypothetical protein
MGEVREHRAATKERESLPEAIRRAVEDVVTPAIAADPFARALTREKIAFPKHPIVLIWGDRSLRTTYRMAWEVFKTRDVLILMYGPHEGFYGRLERRLA